MGKDRASFSIFTLVQRTSRMVILVKHDTKHSAPIMDSIRARIGTTALSCTFDNGSEFAQHYTLGIPTFSAILQALGKRDLLKI